MRYLHELRYHYPLIRNVPEEVLPFVLFPVLEVDNQNEKFNLSRMRHHEVQLGIEKVSEIWNSILQFKNKDFILTPALPRGNVAAEIMIVGQNPGGRGKEDSRYTVLWYDGPNSGFILKCVEEAGIFQDSWFTNLVLFPTPDNKITKDQVGKTSDLFNKQVEIIKPKVFIALGKVVAHYLKDNKFDIPVIEAAHPAYVRRFLSGDPINRENYINTLASAKIFVNIC